MKGVIAANSNMDVRHTRGIALNNREVSSDITDSLLNSFLRSL